VINVFPNKLVDFIELLTTSTDKKRHAVKIWLTDLLTTIRGAYTAVEDIGNTIEQANAQTADLNLSLDAGAMLSSVGVMTDLRLALELIGLFGLSEYKDEIMRAMIAKRIGTKIDTVTLSSSSIKDIANAARVEQRPVGDHNERQPAPSSVPVRPTTGPKQRPSRHSGLTGVLPPRK